jgi:hypothetical protein
LAPLLAARTAVWNARHFTRKHLRPVNPDYLLKNRKAR